MKPVPAFPLVASLFLLAAFAWSPAEATAAGSAFQSFGHGSREARNPGSFQPLSSVFAPQGVINTGGFAHANGIEVRGGKVLLVHNGGRFVQDGTVRADWRGMKPSPRITGKDGRAPRAGWCRTAAGNWKAKREAKRQIHLGKDRAKDGPKLFARIFGGKRHDA